MRRRTRLLLVVAVGVAGAGVAVAGVLPQGFVSVQDVAGHPHQFAGQEVHVKAVVVDGSVARGDGLFALFKIADGPSQLPVEYKGSLPEMFGGGRTVVVSGMVDERASGPVLVASSIQGGCASKYEPGAPQLAADGAPPSASPGAEA